MVTDLDLEVHGRTLHVYDTGATARERFAVVWHHGTPNTGAPPEPLFAAAERLGIRWVSYDRPGYKA
jgi:pimeloyl-ACP methyl ester carboxylesterase